VAFGAGFAKARPLHNTLAAAPVINVTARRPFSLIDFPSLVGLFSSSIFLINTVILLYIQQLMTFQKEGCGLTAGNGRVDFGDGHSCEMGRTLASLGTMCMSFFWGEQ
jgi:hypothetical protein